MTSSEAGHEASGGKSWFIVTSHGWSASHWLAYNLNRHPKITCLHSSAALIADVDEPYDPRLILEQGDFRSIFNQIEELRQGYRDRKTRAPIDLYREAEKFHPADMVGSVHTFRLRDLPNLQGQLLPTERPLRIANLLRHPVNLVNSGFGQFSLSLRLDLNELMWVAKRIVDAGLPAFEGISARHGIYPGDIDPLCFLAACVTLRGLAEDFAARDTLVQDGAVNYLGTIRKEDVTRDPEVLATWIERLNGSPLPTAETYFQDVYADGKRNVHNHQDQQEDPREIFFQWSKWQQEVFSYCIDHYNLRPLYTAEGYDLTMLPWVDRSEM